MSTKKGAQTTIYCAIAPELAKETGKYYTWVSINVYNPKLKKEEANDIKGIKKSVTVSTEVWFQFKYTYFFMRTIL